MRAAAITTVTGPGDVHVLEVFEPAPAPGPVRIHVHHAAMALPDALQTRGEYR